MLLEKLKAGVNNRRTVPFHGAALTMRVLSESELQLCRSDAMEHAARLKLDDEGLYNEISLRQLFSCLTDPEGRRLAESMDSFRQHMSRTDREYLIDEYLALEKECSPSLEKMTEDEFAAILEDAKKNPDSLLSGSGIATLRRLVRYLESRQGS